MSELADKLISLIEGGDPHMDGSTTQPWPKYVDRPGQVSVVMPGVVQGIIYDAAAELRRLERWKSEALIVLAEWGKVHEALGSPGRLGEVSKAKASLAEVKRLKQEVKDLRDANAKRARDNKWPTVL